MSTAASSYDARTSRTPLGKTEWVEYSDSLEDLLTEAKEYAAALETKSEATQASLMAKLELAMEQNTKLLAMMAKGGFNSNTSDGAAKDQLRRGQRREKKTTCVQALRGGRVPQGRPVFQLGEEQSETPKVIQQ